MPDFGRVGSHYRTAAGRNQACPISHSKKPLLVDFENVRLLVDHPQAGRVGRIQDTRELVVHRHYVFVYDLQEDRVRILRVPHTSLQRLPVKPPTKARKGK